MGTVDSVGMENVKRFKDIFFRERGIWFSIQDLKDLIGELENKDLVTKLENKEQPYKGFDENNNVKECNGIGFMVGVGKDFMFNVEVIPLYGEKNHTEKEFSYFVEGNSFKNEDTFEKNNNRKTQLDNIFYAHKLSVCTGKYKRPLWWEGGILIRDINKIENSAIQDKYAADKADKVRGVYSGTIPVTHEVGKNEAQRFPPPEV